MNSKMISNEAVVIRSRYQLLPDASVVLIGCDCSDDMLEQYGKTCIQALAKDAGKHDLHFFLLDGIRDESRQKAVDGILRDAWQASVRPRMHIYALPPAIPIEFMKMADVFISLNENPNDVSLAKSLDIPVLSPDISSPDGTIMIGRNIAMQSRHDPGGDTKASMHASRPSSESEAEPPVTREPSVTLLMRASDDTTVIDAVDAAVATFPRYHTFLIAASPNLKQDILAYLRSIPRASIVDGVSDRHGAGDLHYRMMDMCDTDWIVNVDDDDLWSYAPDLKTIDGDTGVVHGNYLFMNYYHPVHHRYRVEIHKGCQITEADNVDRIDGSMWIMNTEAWKSIAVHMSDRSFNHSDWRAFYALIQNGWNTSYHDQIFGIQRRFQFDFPKNEEKHWEYTLGKLKKNF